MNAEILCVGTELLLGDIVNTNAAFLAKELALCGIGCYSQTVVGDNPERLKTGLELGFSRADIVVMTGGLGPTYDDLTKETVAECFGLEMEMHEPSLEAIRGFFGRIGRPMTHNNEKQAMMPKGAVIFPNDRGTAPGLAVEGAAGAKKGKIAILMPGPPREMTAMFEREVRPYLLKKSDTRLKSHTIHLFGIGEAALEDKLREKIEHMRNPTVAPYAKEGEVQLRVTASAKSEEEADALIKPVLNEICGMFPDYVYGVDVESLQSALVRELTRQGKTVAVAESCTGGLITSRITDVAGSSKVFGYGCCTYSNEAKIKLLGVSADTLEKHGAVSRETALEMARGVKKLSGAWLGVSVTGIAGPDGGTEEKPVGLVYIGICTDANEEVRELRLGRGYGGERAIIRNAAASNALNMALKQLESAPA